MVLLGRAMVKSHRLSIKATIVSGTIWPPAPSLEEGAVMEG